jgi:AhpD family alkylhydroperoxidase
LSEAILAKVELVTRERAPLLARPYYESGDPGPIAAALANVPELMDAALPFIGAIFGPTILAPRLKEIVVLRVSSANGCRYCTETHTRVARRLGFEADELAALRGEGPIPARWGAHERALLAFSQALSERPAESVDLLLPHFAEPEVVELVTLGSATILLNRFATALELPW